MITIIRVVIAVQFNIEDVTYDIAKASIVISLEPSMGLIVACMPMLPPTFKKMLHGKQKLDSRNYLFNTVARLRVQNPKKSVFHKLDDSCPLTDLEEPRIRDDITGPDGKRNALV